MTATATISLDYFHGTENKMCSFYRIPKAFEKVDPFKAASLEAKYLYSLMLDRIGISIRNGWFDAGRAFIYFGVKEIIETIRVGKNKALQIIRELEKLGLILREKQGQGKPAKIFVKNIIERNEDAAPSQNETKEFEQDHLEKQENQKTINKEESCEAPDVSDSMEAVSDAVKQELSNGQAAETTENTIEDTENAENKTASPGFTNPCAYSSHADSASISAPSPVAVSNPAPAPDCAFVPDSATVHAPNPAPAAVSSPDGPAQEPQTSHFQTSGSPKMGSQEVYTQDPNYNKRNKNQENKNDFSYIHPSICANEPFRVAVRRLALSERMDEMEECRESVRDLISYEDLIRDLPQDRRIIDGYVEILTETLNSDKDTIRIGQQDYSIREVKDRLYQLTREHILYVRECMKNTTTRIYNMRAYILTALFNAPVTMEQYYDSKVSHDMAEEDWGSGQYGTDWKSRSQS